MEHSALTAESIVKSAHSGVYAVPEFQRRFVWTPRQVLDFADSLTRTFPVGSILTWKSNTAIQRGDSNRTQQKSWLIDGQQRTTALCTLFDRRPDWWDHNHSGSWADHLNNFDVRLDVGQKELKFVVRRTSSAGRYIRIRDILKAGNIFNLAQELVSAGHTYTKQVGELAQHLQKVADLKKAILPVVEIDDDIDLTDVAEIFKRLNSTGTRVQQADIYLGVVASRNPGWVNNNFITFMDKLENAGFEIEPAFLFRSFTAIGAGRSRFKDVPADFWENIHQNKKWDATKRAMESVCQGLRGYGIINADLALSLNAFVNAAIYRDKFPDGNFGPLLAWMLHAIKSGFFGGPTETRTDRVIAAIRDSDSCEIALKELYRVIDIAPDSDIEFQAEEFIGTRSTRNSLQRIMIYLISFSNNAQDWTTNGYYIRAEASGIYKPEWHHIFPRKWLRDNCPSVDDNHINSVANMAVISGEANRKIAASAPCDYVPELDLANRGLLAQQAIPDPTFVEPVKYLTWLETRAEFLATASNRFLSGLRDFK